MGTLHLLCGKIASGKSTLAGTLVARHGAVLVEEDALLATLYPGEVRTLEDYRDRSVRLQSAIGPLIVDLLRTGANVVLDFQANTRRRRDWLRSLADGAQVAHELHFLDLPEEILRERLRTRNASGKHPYRVDEATFERFSALFEPPAESELRKAVCHAVS